MSDENAQRPAKRPRLDAHAVVEARTPNDDTALEIDIMMVDYLAYQSTTACFASRDSSVTTPVSLAHNLVMTDAFLAIFNSRHPTHVLDPELRFRLHLLQLATLFTQRLTRNPATPAPSATRMLRANNLARARGWIGSKDRQPSAAFNIASFDSPSSFPTTEELERNRAYVLHQLDVPAEDDAYEDSFYGTSSCVNLLDLLPQFMQVSAARSAMSESSATEQWMRLAGEFMLQACLEQYLVCGGQGFDAIDEAFAWGYRTAAMSAGREEGAMDVDVEREGGDEVNDMFEDSVYKDEIDGWRQTKEHYIGLLFPAETVDPSNDAYSVPSSSNNAVDPGDCDKPPLATDLVSHLEMAVAKHPIAAFENTMLGFLSALSQSIAKPVLVQLESGALDGMSREETSDFVRS